MRYFCDRCGKEDPNNDMTNVSVLTSKPAGAPIELGGAQFCGECLPTVTQALRGVLLAQKAPAAP